jgi:hypothetical protein
MSTTTAFLIYFMPRIVALLRGRSFVFVFLINLFLGWTVIGWIIALAKACSSDRTIIIRRED